MLYHRQRNKVHLPRRNRTGDCVRTAIACVMDCAVEEVPSFSKGLEPGEYPASWWELLRRTDEWLGTKELTLWTFPIHAETVDEVCAIVARNCPHMSGRYMVLGRTERNMPHMIVCHGEAIEWNANPDAVLVAGGWPDNDCFLVAVVGTKL